jgi:uncharacterized protein YbaR (Trm112 family)
MAEIIACPACQRTLQVPESFFGQRVECPDCAQQFVAEPHKELVKASASLLAPSDREGRPGRRRRDYDDDDDFGEDDGELRRLRRSGAPHRGGVILALGIIALVIFPYSTIVCGPLAWIMGTADLAEIRAGNMDPSGEGMVRAGQVLGIISTMLLFVSVMILCSCIGLMVLTGPR